MAGSPCPIEVMKKVQSQMNMGEVTIAYGMTETSPVSTQCATDDPVERRVSTVGQVLPHLEIKIVDPEGRAVPRGAPLVSLTASGPLRPPHAPRTMPASWRMT